MRAAARAETERRLTLHEAAVEAALSEVDDQSPLADAMRKNYEAQLAVLQGLEKALVASTHPAPVGGDARLAEALAQVAGSARGGVYSLRSSEAIAWGQGRPAMAELAPYRRASESADVLAAAVPLLDPPASEEEAEALLSAAYVLASRDASMETAAPLARRACERLGRDAGRELAGLREWVRLARGYAALRDGRVKDALEVLAPTSAEQGLRGLDLELFYAAALQKAGRVQEAAVRWAMMEANGWREGTFVLAGHVGKLDVAAARSAPEVVAVREARAAAQARREAQRRPVPTLHVATASGERSLDALREGRAAVVVFWSRTCGYCLEELEALARLQQRYGDRIAFLPVATDEDPEKSRDFLQDKGWGSLPFLRFAGEADRSGAAIDGVPFTVYVDRSGRECRRSFGFHGAKKLEARLRALADAGEGCPRFGD